MARSHHRKKHKAHVQQFKHRGDLAAPKTKGNATFTFLAIGAIVGFLICYFVSEGVIGWGMIGLVAGGIAGYLMGRNVDRRK
jgi:hypothetical protein